MAAAIELSRTTTSSTGGDMVLAFASAVTSGATLFCFGGDGAADNALSCSDSVNGAWTEDKDLDITLPQTAGWGFWYKEATGAGTPTVTIDMGGGASAGFIWIGQLVAASTPPTFAASVAVNSISSTTPDPGDLTPTDAENVILAVYNYGFQTRNGLQSGWTQGPFSEASIGWYVDTAYIENNAVSLRTCEMDHDGANHTAIAALFEVSGGGGGTWPLGNPLHRPFRSVFQRGIS